MRYYEFTPGQKARDWIAGERCEPSEMGPCFTGKPESVAPGELIPDHFAVSEAWAADLIQEGYTLTKIGG